MYRETKYLRLFIEKAKNVNIAQNVLVNQRTLGATVKVLEHTT